jgi:uncharacterized protein YlxW (UPF0749 family)
MTLTDDSHAAARQARTDKLRREIAAMRGKQARLAAAVAERSQALNRLEASAVLGVSLPTRLHHE